MHDASWYEKPKTVRLPIPLYMCLQRMAEENHRTIAAELRVAVEGHVDRDLDARYPSRTKR